jgi:alpha-tubulin suppressor-like RCC1 family protein
MDNLAWRTKTTVGAGDEDDYVKLPKFVKYQVHIAALSCGAEHSVLLTAEGELYSMGSNGYGQLGLGQMVRSSHPDHLQVLPDTDSRRDREGKHRVCELWGVPRACA